MSNKIERRFITAELRMDSQGEDGVIQGMAALYYNGDPKRMSQDLGGFRERIAPGAFKRCLAKNPDVPILFNHDASLILGRTGSGTAEVGEDNNGLFFRCKLGQQTYAQDLRISMQRGDVHQCSFGFTVDPDDDGEDEWSKERDGNGDLYACRTIKHFSSLLDCSPVTYPAYQATFCGARALFPNGKPEYVTRGMQNTAVEEAVNSYQRSQRRNMTRFILG